MTTSNVIQVPDGDLVLWPHQQVALKELETGGRKRSLLLWHRRSGKDLVCWVYLIRQAASKVGIYHYVWPHKTTASIALWNGMIKGGRRLLDLIPSQIIKKINHTKFLIELVNGSLIYVTGSAEPDNLRGIVSHGVIFSEYAWQDPIIWNMIFSPIMLASKGWAIFNSTPDGPNHYYDLYKGVVGNPAWFVSIVKNSSTGIITKEAIKAEIDTGELTEEGAKQEYECEFTVATSGSFFGDNIKAARDAGRVGHYDFDPNKKVDTYWDIGKVDDTVIWFVQRDGSRYNIIDYYEDRGKAPRDYYNYLMSKSEYRYRFHALPHDGARHHMQADGYKTTKDIFDELLKEDPTGRSGKVVLSMRPNRKLDAINGIRSMFHTLYFNEKNVSKGLRRLELYKRKYKPNTKSFSQEALHDDNSHAADAIMNIFLARAKLEREHELELSSASLKPYKINRKVDIWAS